MSRVELLIPASLGITTSGLGLATCRRAVLQARGPAACSPNAVMGYGSVYVQAHPYDSIRESARLTLLAGPVQDNQPSVLVYADGEQPASVQLVDPGMLLPAPAPFGGSLSVRDLELIPGIENITVSILRLQIVLGPRGLIYYEHVASRRGPYHPDGIALPTSCPRGAFPFQVRLTLQDGSRVDGRTAVPCPPAAKRSAA